MSIPASARADARLDGSPRPASPAGGRRRPVLRVVGRPRRSARFVLTVVVVAVAGVIGVVSLSALAAEAAFDARALHGEVAELSLRYDELTSEVAALEAPARVRAVAESELGMVSAETPTYLVAEGSSRAPAASFANRTQPLPGQ